MTRRNRDSSTTDDEVDSRNGYSSSSHNHHQNNYKNHQARLPESDGEEEETNEVIEIDSDDSEDELNLTNNNESTKNEQNNNRDRESSESDIVVVSDDFQKFHEEIERLSRINTKVHIHPDDKVSNKNFKMHKLLGTGAYGKVFLVEKLDGVDKGQLYAMKVLEKNKVTQKKKTTEHTRTEREVLEKVINCPFLVTLYYAFQTAEKLYLVMEFVQGGELFSHLYKSENFTEDQVRFYIAEIIVALEQLHRYNIIYRDIKLENILLDADGHIIITDFGLSKELTDGGRATSYCGTIEYMAPEIVNPHLGGHDLNVDWWSVGVLIIELLSGQSPFSREGEDSNQQLISERIQRQPPVIPAIIGRDAKDLILKLLEKDPRKRLGYRDDAAELKKHKFFRNIDWNILTQKRYHEPMKPSLENKFDVSQFSEDFTNQPAVDGPAESGPLVAPNGHNFFRGYSFVAPHLRRHISETAVLQEMSLTDRPPEMNRPMLKDVFKYQSKRNSQFFKKYFIPENEPPIGDGTYSLCMKCISRHTQEEFAVKIMKIDHDASQEIQALEKCQGHKNIVKLVETMQDKNFNYIIFELLSGGELFSRIRESGFLTESIARVYFQQIVEAVVFTHSKGIIHKDLKPENILFVDNSVNSLLRIVDFGFAQRKSSEESLPCFTLDYAAPESLVKGETKPSRDLWSLGVILYTMLCGNTPFKPLNPNLNGADQDERNFRGQITENIRKGLYNVDTLRWNQISVNAQDLIEKLIKVNESERMSLDEVLNHPWLLNDDKNSPTLRKRAESEETVIHDADYDETTIMNDENPDETRSMDDSSSGIVLSDRNEGSSTSVSREEIDPGHIYENNVDEDDVSTTTNDPIMTMTEEQIEPENLSLKEMKVVNELVSDENIAAPPSEIDEKIIEDENEVIPAVVGVEEVEKESHVIPKKTRNCKPRKPSTDAIHINNLIDLNQEFRGFTDNEESDDKTPFFGFSIFDRTDDNVKKLITLYKPLFVKNILKKMINDQVLVAHPVRRGRKRKANENHEEEAISGPKRVTRSALKSEVEVQVETIEEVPNDPVISTKRGRGRPTAAAKPHQQQLQENEKPIQKLKGTRRRVQQPAMEVKIKTPVKQEPPKKRGRKKKEVEITPIVSNEPKPSRGRKRKIQEEVEKVPVKMPRVQPLAKATRSRRNEVEGNALIPRIKPEKVQSSTIIFQNQQSQPRIITRHQQTQQDQPFASRFRETLVNIRNNYVDNKNKPSLIVGQLIKPEPVDKSIVNIQMMRTNLRSNYR